MNKQSSHSHTRVPHVKVHRGKLYVEAPTPTPNFYVETWFRCEIYVLIMSCVSRVSFYHGFVSISALAKFEEHLALKRKCRHFVEMFTTGCTAGSWHSWWRHQMETFSALLAICAENSPVTGEFHTQRPVTRSFDVFFDLCPNERLSKQSWGWWFGTLSSPLWRHRNVTKVDLNMTFYNGCNYLSMLR